MRYPSSLKQEKKKLNQKVSDFNPSKNRLINLE